VENAADVMDVVVGDAQIARAALGEAVDVGAARADAARADVLEDVADRRAFAAAGAEFQAVEPDVLDRAVRDGALARAAEVDRARYGNGGLRAAADGRVVPLEQEMPEDVRLRQRRIPIGMAEGEPGELEPPQILPPARTNVCSRGAKIAVFSGVSPGRGR